MIYPSGIQSRPGGEELESRLSQLEADSQWAAWRENWQPLVIAKVTSVGIGDNVNVKAVLVRDTQESDNWVDFTTLEGWEGKAFSIGSQKLNVNNLVTGMPINLEEGSTATDAGEPWLAVIPTPTYGSITSYALISGETDRWHYTVWTSAGVVSDCWNDRENGNTVANFQGYARSTFPGGFTVKPIAVGEYVTIIGATFSVSNLVVCT